jgi:hypothetical protein
MSDWANTPIKHRLDARQVKVTDTAQDAFVGAADSAYYADVITNAPEIAAPSAPTGLAAVDDAAHGADVSWTDAGEASDGNYIYYITGTVTDAAAIIAGGTGMQVTGGSPQNVATGAGTWSFAVAGYNDFGAGSYAVVSGIVVA